MRNKWYWGRIPGRNDYLDFLSGRLISSTYLSNQTSPFLIWSGAGLITPIEFSKDEQEYFNEQGIDVYLFDPITVLLDGKFSIDFPSSVDVDKLTVLEFESLNSIVKVNNLTNVRVFTFEYLTSQMSNKYPNYYIGCLNIFLKWYCGNRRLPSIEPLDKKIIKKFHCSNWRHASYRFITTAYMSNYDGYYSWYYHQTYDDLFDNCWFKKENIPSNVLEKLSIGVDILSKGALTIDYQSSTLKTDILSLPKRTRKLTDSFRESLQQSFCAIVTETRYALPFGVFTEKAFNSIETLTPFILVAPPRSLEFMHKSGFKTFGQWWDESYDLEFDHTKRLLKIFEIVEYIDSKSQQELETMYQEMHSVLLHNRYVLTQYALDPMPLP